MSSPCTGISRIHLFCPREEYAGVMADRVGLNWDERTNDLSQVWGMFSLIISDSVSPNGSENQTIWEKFLILLPVEGSSALSKLAAH